MARAQTIGEQAPTRTIPVDTFRARLKLARLHAGDLTMREAAQRCGLIHASWANWEKGMEPRGLAQIAEAISEGLGVDRDWLLFGGPLAQPERRTTRHLTRRRTSNERSPRRTDQTAGATRPVTPTDQNSGPTGNQHNRSTDVNRRPERISRVTP
jgi:transcriptional regulator with XRE-family HTH domain